MGLFTDSATATLPIIGLPISIVGFYYIAPLILLAGYIYFHLDLQRLWDTLAKLPIQFPDGRTLDEKSYPWLLGGLVRVYARKQYSSITVVSSTINRETLSPTNHLTRIRLSFWQRLQAPYARPFLRFQKMLCIVLAWYAVPCTLFLLWSQYIRSHEQMGVSLHVGYILSSLIVAWIFYGQARWSLTRRWMQNRYFWSVPWDIIINIAQLCVLLLAGCCAAKSLRGLRLIHAVYST